MDKNTRHWLMAGGAAAAGAGLLALSTWIASGYMVRMAMDRRTPGGGDRRIARISGNPDNHMVGGLNKARRTGVTKPIPREF